MESNKVINFLKKYRSYIFLPIISILQLVACFYYDFWILATVFAVALYLISDFAHIIYYTLFFQMFSSCGKFSVISTFTAAAVILIMYIKGLITKKEKFYTAPFALTCFICLLGSIHHTTINEAGVYQGASLIVALFFIYLIFVYRDRFKLRRCADYLVFGILTTALISLLTILFKTHHSHFVEIFGNLHRLKLLTGNENSLAIYCSIALSIYISNILTKKDHLVKNIILGLATLSFGISTRSKCFLIVCCFIMVYLFFMLIVKYKLKSFKFIIPTIALFVIFSLIFDGTIDATLKRFAVKVDEELSLNALTSGRSTLWTMYFNEITSSIRKLLLGVGLFSERLVRIGPHNLLIHLIYRMGLIGIFLLGLLCYFYYQAAKGTRKSLKPTLKTSLTLVVFIMISMVESFL